MSFRHSLFIVLFWSLPARTHVKRRCQGRNQLKFSWGKMIVTYRTKELKILFHKDILFLESEF